MNDEQALVTLGRCLAAAWADGRVVAASTGPMPSSLTQAEQAQDAFLQAAGFEARAWKLGASTFAARRALGLDRPFLAPLPAERRLDSPAQLRRAQLRQQGVECELAAALRPLDAAEQALFLEPPSARSLALTAELVTACHAAIELPESRFAQLGGAGPLALVADNGAAGWVVIGPAGDAAMLGRPLQGRLLLDGSVVAQGDASAFVAEPLRLVQAFLHQALSRRLLPTGPTVVLLGSVTPYHPVAGPATVVAQFDGLPVAELRLTD